MSWPMTNPSAASAAVNVDNLVFSPQTITAPVGATVTWTNKDDIPHTSVSIEGVFKSQVMDTDEKFFYTFAKAGTYLYYCTIHPENDRRSRSPVSSHLKMAHHGTAFGSYPFPLLPQAWLF